MGAPQSSSRPSGMDSSLSAMHVLHLLLIRLCWQMLPPPHSRVCLQLSGSANFWSEDLTHQLQSQRANRT